MIEVLQNGAEIDRNFAIELFAEAARMEISTMAKAAITSSNKRFGQFERRHRERIERAGN